MKFTHAEYSRPGPRKCHTGPQEIRTDPGRGPSVFGVPPKVPTHAQSTSQHAMRIGARGTPDHKGPQGPKRSRKRDPEAAPRHKRNPKRDPKRPPKRNPKRDLEQPILQDGYSISNSKYETLKIKKLNPKAYKNLINIKYQTSADNHEMLTTSCEKGVRRYSRRVGDPPHAVHVLAG